MREHFMKQCCRPTTVPDCTLRASREAAGRMAAPVQGLRVTVCIATVYCSDFIGYFLLPSRVVPSLAIFKNHAKWIKDLTIRPETVKHRGKAL